MADYYTKFSVILHLGSKEALDYAIKLHNALQDSGGMDSDRDTDYGFFSLVLPDWLADFKALKDAVEGGVGFSAENMGGNEGCLWLYSDMNPNMDALAAYVQHLMHKFSLSEPLDVAYSFDCSKMRVDGFGGGLLRIYPDRTKEMNSLCNAILEEPDPGDRYTAYEIALMAIRGKHIGEIFRGMDTSDEEIDRLTKELEGFLDKMDAHPND